jgi:glutathione synthase/RimK-type ligase-like ATP-grasp enzyme
VPLVALATCLEIPEPDLDEALLVRALGEVGVDARVVPWDGDPAGFDGADRVILRSTWNYYLSVERFLCFIEDHRERLDNPAHVLRWNAHKGYLLDLEAEGIPVVPTAFVSRGEESDLERLAAERGWGDVVVKPAVSAASHSTRRFQAPREGRAFLKELARRVDVMVQPYLPSVDDHGERSIVAIDGAVTHAVRKSPRLSGQEESVARAEIAPEERRFAERVLARFPAPLLYARVDVMRGPGGEILLSELEVIEPSLFLVHCPEALRALAEAIALRVGRVRPVRSVRL